MALFQDPERKGKDLEERWDRLTRCWLLGELCEAFPEASGLQGAKRAAWAEKQLKWRWVRTTGHLKKGLMSLMK